MDDKKDNVINIISKIPFKYKDAPVETIIETLKDDVSKYKPQQGLYVVVRIDGDEESVHYDYAGMNDEQFIATLEKIKYLFLMKRFGNIDD